jgi:tartrate dehydrogenase/decarboxylase/D-malate dehydrogenase
MMLEHLGHPQAAQAIVAAIERCLVDGPRTPDLGGKASTEDIGKAIASAV